MTDTIWLPDLSDSVRSKYIVLIQSIRDAVRSGKLSAGSKLPPVRELAWDLGITPGTVARAYKMAAEEGLVETTVGRGTFVSGTFAPPQQDAEIAAAPLIPHEPDGTIDFRGVHVPDVGQDEAIRAIMGDLSRGGGHDYLDYPTDSTDYAARVAVAHWIGNERAGRIRAEDVVLGLGAQKSCISALQAVLHGATPIILTESLCYPGVRHAARLLRARLIGVEMDDQGLRPDRLEEVLRQHGGQVLLTSAETHSPTTTCTSPERRQQIALLARKYQLQIIEDDCHTITRPEFPAYRALCPERAWFISSLSKTVSASLRFGYSIAPEGQGLHARQVAQSTYYGLPQITVDIGAALLRSGGAEQFRRAVQERVAKRVQLAVNRLGQWEINWRVDAPFLWLKLPQGWRGSTFARACETKGIRVKPADEFALADGQAPNAVRLSLDSNLGVGDFELALQTMSGLLSAPPLNVDI
ncbi:MAG: PLP-dependent aminotransferase family protein [Pseudomonadota bacterium]